MSILHLLARPGSWRPANFDSELLRRRDTYDTAADPKLVSLIDGEYGVDAAHGRLLDVSGTSVIQRPVAGGLGVGSNTTGDVASPHNEAFGGSACVMAWHGWCEIPSSGVLYLYACGDYNGTGGRGIAIYHASVAGHAAYFDGSVRDSGQTLATGYHSLVVSKQINGGTSSMWIDGALVATFASDGALAGSQFAVGSVGKNQSGNRSHSYTTLALSARYLTWTDDQAKRWHYEPESIFEGRRIWVPVSAGGGDGIGSSAGAATVSGVGASTYDAASASTGAATAAAVGASTAASVATAAGAATATGVGASTADAVGNSQGAATITAVGAAISGAVGSAAGAAGSGATGASTAHVVGASAGAATADGIGSVDGSSGSSGGAATVLGVGAAIHAATGVAGGASTVSAVGQSTAAALGASAGVATAQAVGQEAANVGECAGTSTCTGVGASIAAAVGLAIGTSTAEGISPQLQAGFHPGYRGNPRDLRDPLLEQVREKWDAIERAGQRRKPDAGGEAAPAPTDAPPPSLKPKRARREVPPAAAPAPLAPPSDDQTAAAAQAEVDALLERLRDRNNDLILALAQVM